MTYIYQGLLYIKESKVSNGVTTDGVQIDQNESGVFMIRDLIIIVVPYPKPEESRDSDSVSFPPLRY